MGPQGGKAKAKVKAHVDKKSGWITFGPAAKSKGKAKAKGGKGLASKAAARGANKPTASKRPTPSMSGFSRDLVPTMSACGQAFPTWARNYFDLSAGAAGFTTMVFVSNLGSTSVFASFVTFLSAGGVGVPTNLGTWAPMTLKDNDDTGGPSSGRAMKMSVGLTNTTKRLDQGGRVAILETSNRISLPKSPELMSDGEWDSVMNGLRSQMNMEPPYDGADFAHPKVRHCSVVDRTKYESFEEWNGSLDNIVGAATAAAAPQAFGRFWNTIGHWPGGPQNDRKMSTMVFIFSQSTTTNTYSVDLRGAWYTRWPTTHIISNHLKDIPHLMGNELGRAPAGRNDSTPHHTGAW